MSRIKLALLAFVLSLASTIIFSPGSIVALSAPGNYYIVSSASQDAACAGLKEIDNAQGCGTKGAGVDNIVAAAVTILSFVAGIAAIIMVVIAGFKYITSNGDAGKVSSAKTTLIYALIGIGIAAIAQVLVHFAVNTAVNSNTPAKTPKSGLCKDGIAAHKSLPATDPACH